MSTSALTQGQKDRVDDLLRRTPAPTPRGMATAVIQSQDRANQAEDERDSARRKMWAAIIALIAVLAIAILIFAFKPARLFSPSGKNTAGQKNPPPPEPTASANAGGKNGGKGGPKPPGSAAPDGTSHPAPPKPGEDGSKTDTVAAPDGKDKLWANPTQGELDSLADTLHLKRRPATEWYQPHWAWLRDPKDPNKWIANTELVPWPHVLCGFNDGFLKSEVFVNQSGQAGVPEGTSRWNVGYGDANGHFCQVVRRAMTAEELAEIQSKFKAAADPQN